MTRYATWEEAQEAVARYNANRCPCGGSPAYVPEHQQVHSVEWHEKNGWPGGDDDA